MKIYNLYKSRAAWITVSVLLAVLLSIAYYMQFHQNMSPCEYCIYQRIVIISMLSVSLTVSVFFKTLRRFGLYLMGIQSLVMSGVSLRHAYIQWNPQASTCTEESKTLVDITQINILQEQSFFKGYGDCSKRVFELFGLSIPEMLSVIFVIALILVVINVVASFKE